MCSSWFGRFGGGAWGRVGDLHMPPWTWSASWQPPNPAGLLGCPELMWSQEGQWGIRWNPDPTWLDDMRLWRREVLVGGPSWPQHTEGTTRSIARWDRVHPRRHGWRVVRGQRGVVAFHHLAGDALVAQMAVAGQHGAIDVEGVRPTLRIGHGPPWRWLGRDNLGDSGRWIKWPTLRKGKTGPWTCPCPGANRFGHLERENVPGQMDMHHGPPHDLGWFAVGTSWRFALDAWRPQRRMGARPHDSERSGVWDRSGRSLPAPGRLVPSMQTGHHGLMRGLAGEWFRGDRTFGASIASCGMGSSGAQTSGLTSKGGCPENPERWVLQVRLWWALITFKRAPNGPWPLGRSMPPGQPPQDGEAVRGQPKQSAGAPEAWMAVRAPRLASGMERCCGGRKSIVVGTWMQWARASLWAAWNDREGNRTWSVHAAWAPSQQVAFRCALRLSWEA